MGTISPRKRKNGSVAYRARVRVMRDGVTYHETETFDRRPAAATWIKQRERELAKPGVIDRVKTVDATLAKAIDRYTEESIKEIGRTTAPAFPNGNPDVTPMPGVFAFDFAVDEPGTFKVECYTPADEDNFVRDEIEISAAPDATPTPSGNELPSTSG